MIRQICYFSSAHDELGETALQCILGNARLHNRGHQITGLLAAGGGVIFQVLEGPRDNVECVLRRIRRDTRHRAIRILQDEMIASRDFAAWPMAFRDIDAAEARMIAAGDGAGDPVVAMLAVLGHRAEASVLSRMKLAA